MAATQPRNAPPPDFYTYALTLQSIPAGGQATGSFRIDADADFITQAVLCSANFSTGVTVRSRSSLIGGTATGTVANGVGGTPTDTFESVDIADLVKLYRDGVPTAGLVSNVGLHLLRVAFQDNIRQWQNEPIRADLLTMEPGRSLFLPTQQVIGSNSNLTVTLFNDMPTGSNDGSANALRGILGNAAGTVAPTITAQVALLGYKRYRS